MSITIIRVPLGNKGLDYCIANKVKLHDYLLDKLVSEMQSMGYSEDRIGRDIVEEALDYKAIHISQLVGKVLRAYKKVPKTVKFEFDDVGEE